MRKFRLLASRTIFLALACSIVLEGCSERRKEAARLEAELEARRRGGGSEHQTVDLVMPSDSTNTPRQIATTDSSLSDADTNLSSDRTNDLTRNPESLGSEDSSQQGSLQTAGDSIESATSIESKPEPTTLPSTDSPVVAARPRDGFTVQIAGTRSHEEANAFIERFKLYGYEPYIAEVTRDGRPYYRIRIGKFDTEQEALTLKAQLAEQHQIDGWVDQGTW